VLQRCCVGLEDQKEGDAAMAAALQINVALWIMIGCATAKIVQFVDYLN
jgi:hypothetical protein